MLTDVYRQDLTQLCCCSKAARCGWYQWKMQLWCVWVGMPLKLYTADL